MDRSINDQKLDVLHEDVLAPKMVAVGNKNVASLITFIIKTSLLIIFFPLLLLRKIFSIKIVCSLFKDICIAVYIAVIIIGVLLIIKNSNKKTTNEFYSDKIDYINKIKSFN